MNVLDENILKDQRQQLLSWHVQVRQIGHDIGRKGMSDEEIIPFLLQLRRPTFFTLDLGFCKRNFCHARYCLVSMDVDQHEAATFVRRLLRYKEFSTQVKRMGTVIRVSPSGLSVWRLHAEREVRFNWDR
jgi:hypothetical protein